jgi:hypothetical protein
VKIEYQFAVITPRIGKRFLFRRLLAIKPKPRRISGNVNTDKSLLTFAMRLALDLVIHLREHTGAEYGIVSIVADFASVSAVKQRIG